MSIYFIILQIFPEFFIYYSQSIKAVKTLVHKIIIIDYKLRILFQNGMV